MSNFLDIKSGAKIRANFVTAPGQTWFRGQCLVINSAAQLEKLAANNFVAGIVAGIALEKCVSPDTGNLIQDSATVIAGQTGSILLDTAIVTTDNLSGTGGWVPGSSGVYGQIGGNYSYNSTSGISVGKALSNPQSNGRLTFLFYPQTND